MALPELRERFGQEWAVTRSQLQPILDLSASEYLDELRLSLAKVGAVAAVRARNTVVLFEWLIDLVQMQGVSDVAARTFSTTHGNATYADLTAALSPPCACRKLTSYWAFSDCGFRRGAYTCTQPELMAECALPLHPFRNGRLSQSAYSLFLFFRDVCDGDLVGWIDRRLAAADTGGPDRAVTMRDAVLTPMTNIFGVSSKVLSMALADLLLGGDPGRERWVTTGASMIAIDTLVHNFLIRTGILAQHGRAHAYGPACYADNGCADIILQLATRIDARTFCSDGPAKFPRLVQHAIWAFCAQGGWNICNGNRIDDHDRCLNRFCPAYQHCDRVPLKSG